MAQSYTTPSGDTLLIPGAYASYKVQSNASSLAVIGTIVLMGEADGGPDWSLEDELRDNSFGPDQVGDVVSKYKSGNLVDAFQNVVAAANDPEITGAPSRIIVVKTNRSTKASSTLASYGSFEDKSYGDIGNLIYYTIADKTSEVIPTTGAFTFIPNVGTIFVNARKDGGAVAATGSLAANRTPTQFVAAMEGLAGVIATGGADRDCIADADVGVQKLAITVVGDGKTVTIVYDGTFDNDPVVGDTLVVPAASVIKGAADANVGAYVITGFAVLTQTITAVKLSDAGLGGAVVGVVTAPVSVGAILTSTTSVHDIAVYTPVVISYDGAPVVSGLGKTLEINELTTGADLLSRCCYLLGTETKVKGSGTGEWISSTGAPKLLTSAAEKAITVSAARQLDGSTESWDAGGQIALKIGFTGTTCAVVVTSTTLTLTPSVGDPLVLTLRNYPSLNDLAAFINAKSGYTCAVGSAAVGQISSLSLDEVTTTAGSTYGNQTCRLKMDAVKFYESANANSGLLTFRNQSGDLAPDAKGLPAIVSTNTYLAGGAKGGTSDTTSSAAIGAISLALQALESVQFNFLVPLFSDNASVDSADGLTDATSSYTIGYIHAACKTHVLKVSTLKRRKNCQAIMGFAGSFAEGKDAAQNLASYRCSLAIQDSKNLGTAGLTQFAPWMSAVKAAGMQAAGFYKAIFKKGINCSGMLMADGSFKDSSDSQVEDALLAGLLVAKRESDGVFRWVSDQTTYSRDNNFVYNSIQAVYVADIISLSAAERMEKAFVGQSLADVTAALAMAALDSIMSDFFRLKLIAASDDAPLGYRDASVKISGPTMVVSCSVKLATALYFVPIYFLVQQVTQSA